MSRREVTVALGAQPELAQPREKCDAVETATPPCAESRIRVVSLGLGALRAASQSHGNHLLEELEEVQ